MKHSKNILGRRIYSITSRTACGGNTVNSRRAVSMTEAEPYIETFAKTSRAGADITFRSADFQSKIVGDGELEDSTHRPSRRIGWCTLLWQQSPLYG